MILGRVSDELDFESLVFQEYVASRDDAEFATRLEASATSWRGHEPSTSTPASGSTDWSPDAGCATEPALSFWLAYVERGGRADRGSRRPRAGRATGRGAARDRAARGADRHLGPRRRARRRRGADDRRSSRGRAGGRLGARCRRRRPRLPAVAVVAPAAALGARGQGSRARTPGPRADRGGRRADRRVPTAAARGCDGQLCRLAVASLPGASGGVARRPDRDRPVGCGARRRARQAAAYRARTAHAASSTATSSRRSPPAMSRLCGSPRSARRRSQRTHAARSSSNWRAPDATTPGALASIERRRANATEDRARLLDAQAEATRAERARRRREIEEEHTTSARDPPLPDTPRSLARVRAAGRDPPRHPGLPVRAVVDRRRRRVRAGAVSVVRRRRDAGRHPRATRLPGMQPPPQLSWRQREPARMRTAGAT